MLKEVLLILAVIGAVLARSVPDEDFDAFADIPFKRLKNSVSVPNEELQIVNNMCVCNTLSSSSLPLALPFHRLSALNRMVIQLNRITWRRRMVMC